VNRFTNAVGPIEGLSSRVAAENCARSVSKEPLRREGISRILFAARMKDLGPARYAASFGVHYQPTVSSHFESRIAPRDVLKSTLTPFYTPSQPEIFPVNHSRRETLCPFIQSKYGFLRCTQSYEAM
jgi:hypothetical protein